MDSKYRVTYNLDKDISFNAHMQEKRVKFKRRDNVLYVMGPNSKESVVHNNQQVQMVNKTEDNLNFLLPRQVKQAKKYRKLFEAMDIPTLHDLKAMIRMNLIRNNEVATEDVNLAEKAFGPDVGAIKSKTSRRRPTQVFSNVIERPDELLQVQHKVPLSMDGP